MRTGRNSSKPKRLPRYSKTNRARKLLPWVRLTLVNPPYHVMNQFGLFSTSFLHCTSAFALEDGLEDLQLTGINREVSPEEEIIHGQNFRNQSYLENISLQVFEKYLPLSNKKLATHTDFHSDSHVDQHERGSVRLFK